LVRNGLSASVVLRGLIQGGSIVRQGVHAEVRSQLLVSRVGAVRQLGEVVLCARVCKRNLILHLRVLNLCLGIQLSGRHRCLIRHLRVGNSDIIVFLLVGGLRGEVVRDVRLIRGLSEIGVLCGRLPINVLILRLRLELAGKVRLQRAECSIETLESQIRRVACDLPGEVIVGFGLGDAVTTPAESPGRSGLRSVVLLRYLPGAVKVIG